MLNYNYVVDLDLVYFERLLTTEVDNIDIYKIIGIRYNYSNVYQCIVKTGML